MPIRRGFYDECLHEFALNGELHVLVRIRFDEQLDELSESEGCEQNGDIGLVFEDASVRLLFALHPIFVIAARSPGFARFELDYGIESVIPDMSVLTKHLDVDRNLTPLKRFQVPFSFYAFSRPSRRGAVEISAKLLVTRREDWGQGRVDSSRRGFAV